MVATFKNQVIRIAQLAGESGVLENARFEGCQIRGPAVLLPSGTKMVNNESAEGSDHIIWEVSNLSNPTSLVGFVLVRNCVFERCTFINIGLTAPEPYLTELRGGWGL